MFFYVYDRGNSELVKVVTTTTELNQFHPDHFEIVTYA